MWRRFAVIGVAAMLGVVVNLAICRGQGVADVDDDQRQVARPIDHVSCVFAGRATRFRYAWDGNAKQVTQVEWQIMIGGRVVSRGNARPTFVGGDHVAILLEMPPVKPGVIMAGELNVTLHTDKSHSSRLKQRLFIFAEDPFVDREQWLQELNMHLIDPKGATLAVFTKHEIPFELLTTVAAIDAVRDGVVILGEGASWSDYSGAVKAAQRASRRGLRVLCLAPKDGDMPLYSQSSDEPTDVLSMLAARESVLQRFDKRFDRQEWLGGPSVVSRLALVSEKDVVLARVTDSSISWPWLEMRFGEYSPSTGGGALIVCGFGIIKYWDEGPVPRYLLRAILEPSDIDRE